MIKTNILFNELCQFITFGLSVKILMKIFFISCLYLILQLLVFNVGHFEKALVENVIYIYREEDIFVNLLIIYIYMPFC